MPLIIGRHECGERDPISIFNEGASAGWALDTHWVRPPGYGTPKGADAKHQERNQAKPRPTPPPPQKWKTNPHVTRLSLLRIVVQAFSLQPSEQAESLH